jgi:hypothetical protein
MTRFKLREGSRMDEKSTQEIDGINSKNTIRQFVNK